MSSGSLNNGSTTPRGSIDEEIQIEEQDVEENAKKSKKNSRRFKLPSFRKKNKPEIVDANEDNVENHPTSKGHSLKSIFKRRPATEANESTETKQSYVEGQGGSTGSASQESNPADTYKNVAQFSYSGQGVNQYPDDNASVGRISSNKGVNTQVAKTPWQSFTQKWTRPPLDWEGNEERAELKVPKSKSYTRWSVALVVILLLGLIAGIVITAAVQVLKVVGACLIVLSIFALIGKLYFTLWSNPEKHPVFEPAARSINQVMYNVPPSSKTIQSVPSVEVLGSDEPLKYRTYSNESYGNQVDNGMDEMDIIPVVQDAINV